MDRLEALECINEIWHNSKLTLGEKIKGISDCYYDVGLDLASTAAFIKATPAELDAMLDLSSLDEEIIDLISEANPPQTTWALLANGSDEEIKQAISAYELMKDVHRDETKPRAVSEFIYQQMLDVSGPTTEQRVGMLSGNDLQCALKKAQSFGVLSDWEKRFFTGIVAQKKKGKTLSMKQVDHLLPILNDLADRGVISRNSIDGDNIVCDRILDAIGR